MRNWRDAVVSRDDSVLKAIESIERGELQIALVLDADGRLAGSVTDGDIRRAILRGMTLDQPVSDVMNTSPFCVAANHDRKDLKETMRARRFHQVPVVDTEGRVIDLLVMDDLVSNRKGRGNWVVLMAGGLGKRLHPLTETTPKPLVDVGGRPLLETIIEKFVSQGFSSFLLAVNYKREQIKAHFGDGERWGIDIRYIEEQEARGTAGALSLIDTPMDLPLVVMNADLVTEVDFTKMIDFHEQQGALATMGVRKYDFQVQFGVVEVEDTRVLAINEKPVHKFLVNAGIYVLEPEALAEIPNDTAVDMPALFEKWLDAGRTCSAFPIHEYWLDIGRIEDLERADARARTQQKD